MTATSGVQSLADIDQPGIRVAGVANTATFRAAAASLKHTTTVTVPGVDAAVAAVNAGQADAIALSRESLTGLDHLRMIHRVFGGARPMMRTIPMDIDRNRP